MKITICNSVHFHEEAEQTKKILEQQGHQAVTHPMEVELRGKTIPVIEYYKARKSGWDDEIEKVKHDAIKEHFNKIKESDAILVLNYDKDGKENYVGGNTFMEIGAAFLLNKKIFMLNPISEELPYAEEIKGMKPTILNGDLKCLK